MNRFLLDALFVILLLIVGYGVIKSESGPSDNINSAISEFDSTVGGGKVIEDGYLDETQPLESQDSSIIAKGVDAFNNIIVKIVDGGFEIFIKLLKGAIS
ncbi:TPA: hypothetical protein GXZ54_03240 [bacterium]|jgi:hypothetical protein|nr:hypothetical protein [bacterium]